MPKISLLFFSFLYLDLSTWDSVFCLLGVILKVCFLVHLFNIEIVLVYFLPT